MGIDEVACCQSWEYLNLFLQVALVYEKLGIHEAALRHAQAAMSTDLTQAGGVAPTVRVLAMSVQGRAFAALGRTADAAAAFEAAADEAHRYGLWLFEAFALRDLKLSVLDGMGHGTTDRVVWALCCGCWLVRRRC